MTSVYRRVFTLLAVLLICMQLSPAYSKPTTSDEAVSIVMSWLQKNSAPMGVSSLQPTSNVTAYYDANQLPFYYVVNLKPSGFVIVSGDDNVEPIIAMSPNGAYDPSDSNPLGALVNKDISIRLSNTRYTMAPALAASGNNNHNKWAYLLNSDPLKASASYITLPSDVRVAPLVQSQWSQSTSYGNLCYNYYTPNNYVCGCVATGMAQVLRYWQYPTTSVGTATHTIYVNNSSQTVSLRGGDGSGGPYNWALMALVPGSHALTTAQYQAIGALCYDAGVSVSMSYASGGSGAYADDTSGAYRDTFKYSNAICYTNWSGVPYNNLLTMMNSNLDGGCPVNIGMFNYANGTYNSGHYILCDGYGYDTGTMYHHLNMGWAGYDDAWYNLTAPDMTNYHFNLLTNIVYNIFPTQTGEIISGRVLDSSGLPVSNASVTAYTGTATYGPVTTNGKGIYAFRGIPSASSYVITAQNNGASRSINVSTDTSVDGYLTSIGNIWGADITFSSITATSTVLTSSANPSTAGENVTFTATVSGNSPTGTVQFTLDGADTGSAVSLSGNTATYSISSLTIGSHTITATYNGDSNNTTSVSNTLTQTVNSTTPAITSLSPSKIEGEKSFTLTVNGTNFVSGSIIKWNGTNITTTYVSPTQLTASINKYYTTLSSYPGSATVSILNPDGKRSAGATVAITAPPSIPAITSLSPTSVMGATTFTLTVKGSNFVSGSVIKFNGTNMTTTYVSGTQLTASINKYFTTLASYPGTATISILNPNGGRSSGATLTITQPITPPVITSLSPSSITGATTFTLTVNGTGFQSGAAIKWNGTNMTTTFVSSTQLTAVINKYYDTLSSYPGSVTISVLNPDSGRSTGTSLPVTSP